MNAAFMRLLGDRLDVRNGGLHAVNPASRSRARRTIFLGLARVVLAIDDVDQPRASRRARRCCARFSG
ncbi:hypothetical protein ACG873_12745 [Mesorhizobium sp. AaZ16]|uniref:hypothetical protein n=1 Tax=Mesorhizobium sp. AaZ16 TaxID=3402289 RepID=UPI00374E2822